MSENILYQCDQNIKRKMNNNNIGGRYLNMSLWREMVVVLWICLRYCFSGLVSR